VLFYHNTILSETAAQGTANTHWRNNLLLGENSSPAIFSVTTFTRYTSSDYNGFRPNPGAEFAFQWSAPKAGALSDYTGPDHRADLDTARFASLEEYRKGSGQDQHSLLVDYDVFVRVPMLDAQDSRTFRRSTRPRISIFAARRRRGRRSRSAAAQRQRRLRRQRPRSRRARARPYRSSLRPSLISDFRFQTSDFRVN
jgi:hypothetical protein